MYVTISEAELRRQARSDRVSFSLIYTLRYRRCRVLACTLYCSQPALAERRYWTGLAGTDRFRFLEASIYTPQKKLAFAISHHRENAAIPHSLSRL